MKKKIVNYIVVVFTCLTIALSSFGLYSYKNKDQYVIYADTNVKINPFVWLCSYLGINIYTEAQEITDAFYDAISVAYATYQQSLQVNQQVSINDIIGSISWDSQQPKMLKISGWAFNALRAFGQWIQSQYVDNTDGLILTTFETIGEPHYFTALQDNPLLFANSYSTVNYYYYGSSEAVRFVVFKKESVNIYSVYACSTTTNPVAYRIYGRNTTSYSFTSEQYINGVYWRLIDSVGLQPNQVYYTDYITLLDDTYDNNEFRQTLACQYTFGAYQGATTLNDIYALPDQATLDDLKGAADPDSDVEIDIEDSDIPWATASQLQDILDAINDLTDSYVIDNSWPETLGKVIAQGLPIANELPDVTYPNAPTWEVPEPIDTIHITPLITPECPTMSACIVSAIEDIGTTMTSIISTNGNIGNYTSAILFMGLALWIIGRGM